MTFHEVRINKRTPNSCAIVAIQALLGTDTQKTAMAINYCRDYGTLNNRIANGLAFLTGKLWLELDTRVPVSTITVKDLKLDNGLVIVFNINISNAGHLIAIIDNEVYDVMFGRSTIDDDRWKEWIVLAYFREAD